MIRVEPIGDLAAARPLWTSLAARSGNVFATWEWTDAWWRHFGNGELALHACVRGDKSFAIAPLYIQRRGPFRLLRFLGHGVGDVLGPICAPTDAAVAGEALRGLRTASPRWTAFLAERVPGEGAGETLAGVCLQSEANPSLEISGRSWDDFLGSASKNMREKLRRNTRKLERDHQVTYELCEKAEQVEPMMRTLFALHGMRWDDGGSLGRESVAPFHLDFAPTAMDRGWLRLWTMKVDGEPVAAWYGFRFGETEAYYQSGRNPRFDRYSVGFLMLMRTIKAAFDDGLANYGFLRGDEAYKSRFASTEGTLETRAIGRGPLGRASVRAGALALQVPAFRSRLISAFR